MPFFSQRVISAGRSRLLSLFAQLVTLVLTFSVCPHAAATVKQVASTSSRASASAVDLMTRAVGLLRAGRVSEAGSLLREALRLDPSSGLARTYLGQSLLRQQQPAAAMDEFEAVLAYEPRDAAALEGERTAAEAAAIQLRNGGKQELALFALQHALTLLPDDPLLLTDLGVQAQAMHRLPLAGESLRRVLELRPGDARALYALARTEIDQEHFADAEVHLRAYLEQQPTDASAHYGLGHLYQVQQLTDPAKAEFNRSLSLQPAQTESYYQLGQMALEAGDESEARKQFAITLNRFPTHGGALTGLGMLDYRAHQYESAQIFLQRAVAASPEYQPAQYYLGLTLKRLGQTAAADAALKRAAELTAEQQGKGRPVQQAP